MRIRKLGRSAVPVLILGESGTGKELCARGVCYHSPYARLVTTNSAEFDGSLSEDALFGHVRGAYTGSIGARKGLVEEAHNATLFLDELAELPLTAQAKLLRVLDSGEFRALGSNELRRSRFRLIAATNEDVPAAIESGKLRRDFMHRIGAACIRLPPLRERIEDIPLLARAFLTEIRERAPHAPARFAQSAMAALLTYEWPGNVRELYNVVEVAAAYGAEASEISLRHLAEIDAFSGGHDSRGIGRRRLEVDLQLVTRNACTIALEDAGGNREVAAETLGISVSTLYRYLKGSQQDGSSNGTGPRFARKRQLMPLPIWPDARTESGLGAFGGSRITPSTRPRVRFGCVPTASSMS